MTEAQVNAELQRMRAALQAIEQRLTSGTMPTAGIQDLKAGVDDLRLRLWAILSASNNPDPGSTLERFRLRRATEMMDSVTSDISSGRIRSSHKEVAQLAAQADRFVVEAQRAALTA